MGRVEDGSKYHLVLELVLEIKKRCSEILRKIQFSSNCEDFDQMFTKLTNFRFKYRLIIRQYFSISLEIDSFPQSPSNHFQSKLSRLVTVDIGVSESGREPAFFACIEAV